MNDQILLIFAFVFAILDWLSVSIWWKWKALEYIAKPATLLLLIAWFYLQTGFSGPMFWFGLGLVFSLLGDLLLLFFFDQLIGGLVAFFLAHTAYIICLARGELLSRTYPLLIALVIGVLSERILRRIVAGVHKKGKSKLSPAVVGYGAIISIMLLLALTTPFRGEWTSEAAVWISVGAVLFYLSDVLLAWIVFINPIKHGRMMNMAAYHLGQFALAIGMVIQFT